MEGKQKRNERGDSVAGRVNTLLCVFERCLSLNAQIAGTMNDRRESRIPIPGRQVLHDSNASDRKRKLALPDVPESSSKRAGFNTSSKPAKSAPLQKPAASQAVSTAPFASEGGAPKNAANGPLPGEETYEDLAARTGVTVTDILNKRMAVSQLVP